MLHLIAAWKGALREVVRVVEPGGVILVDVARWDLPLMQEVQERFASEAGISPGFPPARHLRPAAGDDRGAHRAHGAWDLLVLRRS